MFFFSFQRVGSRVAVHPDAPEAGRDGAPVVVVGIAQVGVEHQGERRGRKGRERTGGSVVVVGVDNAGDDQSARRHKSYPAGYVRFFTVPQEPYKLI